MKVCLITSSYKLGPGDASVPFLVENVRRLVERGATVHIFAPSYEGCPSGLVDGVPVHRFRYFFKCWENLTHRQGAPNRIRNPLYLVVALFYILFGLLALVRFCRRHRFDVLHVHWPFPHGLWGYAASRVSGTPMVLTFHGAELLLCRRFPFVRFFLRHALKHARGVICNSTYTAGEVAKLTDKPVQVIPFGCTVDARPAAKDPHKPVKDVLFAGRLIARKGVRYLVEAVPLLEREGPVHVHVVGDGDQMPALRQQVQELGVGDRVTLHGTVSARELERHYAQADVFVLPAIVDEYGDTEGLGVVLVEALGFKTPVVASNVGGIPDVIRDGRTGLLVPEKDLAALARAVGRLLRDRALAESLAEEGLRHARDYFDWDQITASQFRFYEATVGSKPVAAATADYLEAAPGVTG
jgi:glycosyltransferase involved in cell wall biosynthesis